MIIDFRMRPPARGFLNIGVYDDVARTAKLTECFSMKQAPSVAQKSPELMLQEMDTAGVTMGVIPGRNGHFKGSISNDDIISLLGDFPGRFVGMEHSYTHLAVGIMLGSALFTLVGISLSAFISTMNNFMLIMVPTLIISVAPISVYTMGYKSGAMLLHPSISLIELMSGNISVISLIAISIWCIAMYIFSCLSVKKMMTI